MGNVGSIRAHHCWWANPRSRPSPGPRTTCFNPRPPLLVGESKQRLAFRKHPHQFQSAPTIAGGRILVAAHLVDMGHGVSIRAHHCWWANPHGDARHRQGLRRFNPRPPLLVGESESTPQRSPGIDGFNPRPPLLVGESRKSRRARKHTTTFQSAPTIAGGRIHAISAPRDR